VDKKDITKKIRKRSRFFGACSSKGKWLSNEEKLRRGIFPVVNEEDNLCMARSIGLGIIKCLKGMTALRKWGSDEERQKALAISILKVKNVNKF
jgi:hypothetical protein